MTKVLVASSGIYGHFAPMRQIASFLAGRGYDVTMLSHESFREAAEWAGVPFVGFTGAAALDMQAFFTLPERMACAPGPERLEWDLRNLFIASVKSQHHDIQRFLAEAGDEPVLLVYETGFLGAVPSLIGAQGLRPAAALGIGVVSFTLSSIDTPPFGMGLPPDSGEQGRIRNREANAFVQEQLLGPSQKLFNQTLADLGVPEKPIPFIIDATILLADRFLQLSIEEMSYKRTDTPWHVSFVGALPTVAAVGSGDLPSWWPEMEAAEHVVVVTQGTVSNQDYADLIDPALEALADLPGGLVIAATGRSDSPRRVPDNARVVEFVPFDDLLPHADVLIANGGFGAIQQALRHAVPLVVAGLSEEKLENCVRLAATGAAVNLATERPTPGEIRKAVEQLLGAGAYRQNARRLAAEYAKHDALAEIERAVADLTAPLSD
jgi:UDP:flavonoid glycosyltransferase YjiC (YdhE family)